ncbi:hypothetical protein Sjap_012064 [Stephania japonica]|uniref:Uncharacterized protein n=1 Tax=Stephania japonica TaxID=461633 RepID=A0AAP0JCB4_9MAGN
MGLLCSLGLVVAPQRVRGIGFSSDAVEKHGKCVKVSEFCWPQLTKHSHRPSALIVAVILTIKEGKNMDFSPAHD